MTEQGLELAPYVGAVLVGGALLLGLGCTGVGGCRVCRLLVEQLAGTYCVGGDRVAGADAGGRLVGGVLASGFETGRVRGEQQGDQQDRRAAAEGCGPLR
ncbi:hypothetical protein ACFXPJ_05645 [Streptomyces goshikiensis]